MIHKTIQPLYVRKTFKLVGVFCFFSLFCCCNSRKNSDKFIDLKIESQKIVDSSIIAINERYKPYEYADSLVNVDQTLSSLNKIDSLILLNPNDEFLFICKGKWFFFNRFYYKALKEYDTSSMVAHGEYPLVLEKKAQVFIAINDLASAIINYKKAAVQNCSYNYQVGYTYELNKELDSALKYYNLYLEENPLNKQIKFHVDSLIKK